MTPTQHGTHGMTTEWLFLNKQLCLTPDLRPLRMEPLVGLPHIAGDFPPSAEAPTSVQPGMAAQKNNARREPRSNSSTIACPLMGSSVEAPAAGNVLPCLLVGHRGACEDASLGVQDEERRLGTAGKAAIVQALEAADCKVHCAHHVRQK